MVGRDQPVPGAGQERTPACIFEPSMEPFECEHKTPVSQGLGEGGVGSQPCGHTTWRPGPPRGRTGGHCAEVTDSGDRRWYTLVLGGGATAPSGGRLAVSGCSASMLHPANRLRTLGNNQLLSLVPAPRGLGCFRGFLRQLLLSRCGTCTVLLPTTTTCLRLDWPLVRDLIELWSLPGPLHLPQGLTLPPPGESE